MSDPTQKSLDALIGIPFVVGGRSRVGIDCYGVTLAVLAIFGKPSLDIWDGVRDLFAGTTEGQPIDLTPLVPAGWVRVDSIEDGLRNGDAVIIPGHVGAMADGYVYTATEGTGSIRQRWTAFHAVHGSRLSVWRWGSRA